MFIYDDRWQMNDDDWWLLIDAADADADVDDDADAESGADDTTDTTDE